MFCKTIWPRVGFKKCLFLPNLDIGVASHQINSLPNLEVPFNVWQSVIYWQRETEDRYLKKTKQPSKTIFDQILAISITKFNAWVDQLIPIQFHFMLDFTDLNQFYLNLKKTVTTCSKCLGISNLRLYCEGPFSTFPLNCSLRMFYWKFTCYKI